MQLIGKDKRRLVVVIKQNPLIFARSSIATAKYTREQNDEERIRDRSRFLSKTQYILFNINTTFSIVAQEVTVIQSYEFRAY